MWHACKEWHYLQACDKGQCWCRLHWHWHDRLFWKAVRMRCNSIAHALELHFFATQLSTYGRYVFMQQVWHWKCQKILQDIIDHLEWWHLDSTKCIHKFTEYQGKLNENITKFVVRTVTADGLVLLRGKQSVSTVMAKFQSIIMIMIISKHSDKTVFDLGNGKEL